MSVTGFEVSQQVCQLKDEECVVFLQWALPYMQRTWPGLRKVRSQVCKRIRHRMRDLSLANITEYRHYLEMQPSEWQVMDDMCHITISSFFRDQAVFEHLSRHVLRDLADQAYFRGDKAIRVWSIGCASGEEPYSIAIAWKMLWRDRNPALELQVLGTDVETRLIQRASHSCYPYSSVKDLPETWREHAFTQTTEGYCLKDSYKSPVQFMLHDVRQDKPLGRYDLILCRNLIFTYFNDAVQVKVLQKIKEAMHKDAVLVIGSHEELPPKHDLSPLAKKLGIYSKA